MSKRRRNSFSFPELDNLEPKGKHAILRSAEEVAAEQALLRSREVPAGEEAHAPNRATFRKVAYRLHPDAIVAIQEAKLILRRDHGASVNLEEIAEAAILTLCQELREAGAESELVRRFGQRGE